MVRISPPLNSAQVANYHGQEFTNARENYYTQKAEITGEWHGRLAQDFGLTGPVSPEHFQLLAEGKHPITGEQLVRHRFETDEAVAHRAAWDATFSAPKSVSIAALLGNDTRLLAAHQAATQKGLTYLQDHVDAHLGGAKGAERTGKWIAALFEHNSARPVDGYAAPQLHTHSVFFNVTLTPDGKSHALDPQQLFKAQQVATAIYQAELAFQSRQLGYTLRPGKNGAFEFEGYTDEFLAANSPRSEQIENRLKELQAQGLVPAHLDSEAKARELAALATRERKGDYTPEQMRAKHLAVAAQHGNQHLAVFAAALERAKSIEPPTSQQLRTQAEIAVSYARDHNFEREAVHTEKALLRDALRRGQGLTTPEHIQAAFKRRVEREELIEVGHRGKQIVFSTAEMIALEKTTIQMMKAGHDRHQPLAAPDTFDQKQLNKLSPSQQTAALELLNNTDTVQALQGAAGSGKTFTLTVVREHLERNGHDVRGLAPTSRATQQLSECGAPCETLQMHLTRPATPDPLNKPRVYLLDETSLASTKQVHDLLERLQPKDRVILIGDERQHEAVEAGRPFPQLQEHGIRTAHLDQIIRQKDEGLKAAVQNLSDGNVPEAVRLLDQQGRVTEVKDETQRFQTIASEFLKAPQATLVVSPDNRSRAAINAIIHDQLRDTGQLQGKDHSLIVLVNRQDISGADREWAQRYEVGNVLRYNSGSPKYKIPAHSYTTVTAIDTAANTITVQDQAKRSITYNPRDLHGVTVYRPKEKAFAQGDTLQFTTPIKEQKIANRERGTITHLDERRLTVKLDSGRAVEFPRSKPLHIDHGYAVTSHSSQALTTDRVLVNIDTEATNPSLINDRFALVSISRARHDAQLYTNDAAHLSTHLARDISKASAIAIETPTLKSSLELMSRGQAEQAATQLTKIGSAVEITGDAQRYQAIAKQYADAPATSRPRVVAADPASRAALNAAIHTELSSAGKLDRVQLQLPVLVPRHDVAQHDLRQAASYQVGNVVRFNKPTGPEYAAIVAVDRERNQLTACDSKGKTFTYQPDRAPNVQLYRVEDRTFAKGQPIEFTSSHPALQIEKSQRATLTNITPEGNLQLRLQSSLPNSPAVSVEIKPSTFPHLEHSYAVQSTYGQPGDKNAPTLVHVDAHNFNASALSSTLTFAATKPEPNLRLYSSDTRALTAAIARHQAEHNASEIKAAPPQQLKLTPITPAQTPAQAPAGPSLAPTLQPPGPGHAPKLSPMATPARGPQQPPAHQPPAPTPAIEHRPKRGLSL